MIAVRLKVICLGVFIMLSGCSSEENLGVDDKKAKVGKSSENSGISPVKQQVTNSADSAITNNDMHVQEPPTRSELRVLSEEAKATEERAKDVIEKFDSNLSDLKNRKSAEAEFKQMLPEYKEKMLQIGKAKLKEGK